MRWPAPAGSLRPWARSAALRGSGPCGAGERPGARALVRALGQSGGRLLAEKPGCVPRAPSGEPAASAPAETCDLLRCPRCQQLLHEPVTLLCGLTVCTRCVEPGPARPHAWRVNVVLSGLLEKRFPDEGRVCRLVGQARSLQRQQQPEAALLRCHQALNLASKNVHQSLIPSIQSRMLNTRLKAQCHSHINTKPLLEEGGEVETSKHQEAYKAVLESILPIAPSTSLKRQFPNDLEDAHDLIDTPGKIPKKGLFWTLFAEISDIFSRLFFEPVTTPCGHTFCLKCLEHCLDHAPHHPLCKEKLSELLASRNFNITVLAEALIFRYLSDELSDRKRIYDEEMTELSNLTRDVPIFVCAMAFPTIPCPLHIFEPCYWLMIRRCMETDTKWFSMCLSAEHTGISEYGFMLEIKGVRTFADGSSVVDAIGISRFRVLSHRHRDGYNTADVEYLEDEKSNPSGPAWSWWILAVLPLEHKAQLAILGMTLLKERPLTVRRILVIITHKMNSWQELVNSRERNS